MNNPETLATMGTQDTEQRQSRDTGNNGHTRHRKKTSITKNTTQKKIGNMDPTKQGVIPGILEE